MQKHVQLFSKRSWKRCFLTCLLLFNYNPTAFSDAQEVPSSEIRRVVVIHLDTTRLDDLGCYGGATQTPNIDALAARGMRYTNAITCVPFTTPSIATFMTGTYPDHHKVDAVHSSLDPQIPTLMEVLRKKGFRTAAFESNQILYNMRDRKTAGEFKYGVFRDGFDVYTHIPEDKWYKTKAPAASLEETCATALTQEALDFVRDQGNDPFFLWMLYYSPHTPYRPPEEFVTPYVKHPIVLEMAKGHEKRRWTKKGKVPRPGKIPEWEANHVTGTAEMIARHLGEVAVVDQSLGALFDLLKSLEGKTLTVVLSDHGESLGDADYWFYHGKNIRYPSMKVPFIIQCDGLVPVGVSHALTDNTDIAPTILELLGFDKDEMHGAGKSLIPSFTQADPWPDRLVPMQSNFGVWKRGVRSTYYSLQCEYDQKNGSAQCSDSLRPSQGPQRDDQHRDERTGDNRTTLGFCTHVLCDRSVSNPSSRITLRPGKRGSPPRIGLHQMIILLPMVLRGNENKPGAKRKTKNTN